MWDEWMRPADQVLDDDPLLSTVYEALAKRRPKSRGAPSGPGRLGTPAEVVLRLPLLKHIRSWRYEVVEREVAAPVLAEANPNSRTIPVALAASVRFRLRVGFGRGRNGSVRRRLRPHVPSGGDLRPHLLPTSSFHRRINPRPVPTLQDLWSTRLAPTSKVLSRICNILRACHSGTLLFRALSG